MTLGPNAGTAHITVRPSLRGWSPSVRRQLQQESKNLPPLELPAPPKEQTQRKGRQAGEQFAGGFDRMVRTKIAAALKAIPQPQIGVATSAAEQRIKDLRGELAGLSKQRIGVDIDAAEATARIASISAELRAISDESVDIDVKADTVLAATELAAVQAEVSALDGRDVDIRVDVDTAPARRGFGVLLGGLGQLRGGLSSVGDVVTGVTSKFGAMGSGGAYGAVAIAGALISLIPVVAVLTTMAATLASTLVAAAAGFGIVLAGVLGNIIPVVKAQSELKQKQEQAASTASAYASAQQQVRAAVQGVERAQTSASRAVADAERALADARRNAARSVRSAEESVAAAVVRSRNAQEALNDARDAARQKLAAYAAQLRGAALDERGAALSVTAAQEALNQVLSDPAASQLAIDQARHALDEAQYAYDESKKSRKELREQAEKDRKAGVAGDQAVLDAKEALAAANAEVVKSERDLAETRADAARSVADAERNLARAQADGARQVAQAQEQVGLAQAAAAEAAAKNAVAQAEVADRLAKMSGPAAIFVKALDRAKDAWGRFLTATAPDSFGLAAQGLDLFSELLPKLVPLANVAAQAFGDLLGSFGEWILGPEGNRVLGWFEEKAPRAIKTIGRNVGNFVIGMGGLIGALTDTDTGFSDLMRRFADFGRSAGENSSVRSFFEYAKENGPVIAETIGVLAGAFGEWMEFLSIFCPVAIAVLGGVYKVWTPILRFLNHRVDQIGRAFGWVGDKVDAFAKRVNPPLRAFRDFVRDRLAPAVTAGVDAVTGRFEGLGSKVSTVWDGTGKVLRAFRDFVRDTLPRGVKRGLDEVGDLWDGLKKAAGTPAKFVVDYVWNKGLLKVINGIPGVKDIKPVDTSEWPSYARGGWTGPGSKYQPAGIVHADEFVVTKEARRLAESVAPGWLDSLNRAGRMRGYANGGRVWPLPGGRPSTYAGHDGVDLNVGSGSDDLGMVFVAAAPGTVSHVGYGRGYGNAVFVRGSYGELVYGHALDGSIRVGVGQPVAAGDPLAQVGSTGNSSAPHLHFGFPGGTYEQALSFLNGAFNGGVKSAGGSVNPLAQFAAAITAAKNFATGAPGMLGKLSGMGAWGKLLTTGVRNIGGTTRKWINDKIPGPGPMPDVFDAGGVGNGVGLMAKRTIRPERVLSPAQTAAYERQVATLESWDAGMARLAAQKTAPAVPTALNVREFRILDWETGLATFEAIATDAAETVVTGRDRHTARISGLDTAYGN